MTITFDNNPDIPHTHVFIVGVGRYPYLKDGDQEPIPDFELAAKLPQLSSPPCSAEAFFNAVVQLDEQKNWIRPLGTVELLVSPLPGQQVLEGVAYAPATMENIKKAYWRWKKRCDSSIDNVAIFYFCGHGFEISEHYLMAEDFGDDKQQRWKNSFPFDTIREAFHSCKAHTQLFFVDACRQFTLDMLTTKMHVETFDEPDLFDAFCKYNLTQKAAAHMEEALGEENQPSYYSKALINALNGKVATNYTGEWVVNTGSINCHITQLMRDEKEDEGYRQRCDSRMNDSIDIIRLAHPPMVTLSIECTPKGAENIAELRYEEMLTKKTDLQRPPGPWRVIVPAGIYSLEATFACGSYKNVSDLASVIPPFCIRKISCHA